MYPDAVIRPTDFKLPHSDVLNFGLLNNLEEN